MTIQTEITKIESEYTVKDGIIVSPGKFEGESIATVYFYNTLGEIGGDYTEISEEERTVFEIDSQYDYAVILTDDSGFTYLEYANSESHAEDRVNEWYNDDEDFEDDSEDYLEKIQTDSYGFESIGANTEESEDELEVCTHCKKVYNKCSCNVA